MFLQVLTEEHLKLDEIVAPKPLVEEEPSENKSVLKTDSSDEKSTETDVSETSSTSGEKSTNAAVTPVNNPAKECDEKEVYEDIEVGLDGASNVVTHTALETENSIENEAQNGSADRDEDETVDTVHTGDFLHEDVEVALGVLNIPGRPKPVSNTCAICLDAYAVGDVVVWSTNQACQHVYHEDCVVDYILRVKYNEETFHPPNQKTPCPICRQPFDEISSKKRTKKKGKGDGGNR